jgi:predicted TPR repeat methyltransferase
MTGTAAERLRETIARHRAGDHAAAEGGYREHLRQYPDDASALHFLGLLRNQQGRNNESITLMLAALEADPAYVDAWSNLGIVYYEERDLGRAEKCCRKAIALAPGFANAWANLALTLRAKDLLEEALHALGRALELNPRMRSAALTYGQLLYRLDRVPQALEFYRGWLAQTPDDPIPQHMLAASGGAGCPTRASASYVRSVFDDFAESFDRSLQLLQYQAPQLLFEAVTASGAEVLPRSGALDILDLGCGTGLCGPLLRPIARHLVGVDLSPKMLSLAAARGLYDQLNCAELTEWLASCRTFDLVVAADVLCYFGALELTFARVRQILTPGGCFGCSLEAAPQGASEPFALCPHGRYQHQLSYIESSLAQAGLQSVRISQAVLRYERKDPVVGHLVVACSPT